MTGLDAHRVFERASLDALVLGQGLADAKKPADPALLPYFIIRYNLKGKVLGKDYIIIAAAPEYAPMLKAFIVNIKLHELIGFKALRAYHIRPSLVVPA